MVLTYPYLTLDWVGRWNALRYPDVIPILEEFRAAAPDQNRIYWDNTIEFVRVAPREDLTERGKFLHAYGYARLTDIIGLDVRPIHMRPIILKGSDEAPISGFTFTFPDQFTRKNKPLRELLDNSLLFIRRQDKQRLLDFVQDVGKREIDLSSAGFIYSVPRGRVEYIDVIMYDAPEGRP